MPFFIPIIPLALTVVFFYVIGQMNIEMPYRGWLVSGWTALMVCLVGGIVWLSFIIAHRKADRQALVMELSRARDEATALRNELRLAVLRTEVHSSNLTPPNEHHGGSLPDGKRIMTLE